ncbi:MAG: hypothetical protein DMG78_31835, partial [Acidobacteria bacterium]
MGLGETTNSAFYLTIKYDADGNQLWVRRLAGFNQWGTEPRGFSVDRFGNAVVTGLRRIADGVDTITTVKYSPSGDELWVRVAAGMEWVSALGTDGDGNAIVVGSTWNSNYGISDITVVKYNSAGVVLWTAHYAGTRNGESQSASGLTIDDAGNIYIAGIGLLPSTGIGGILSLKYSPQGTLLQSTAYGDVTGRWLGSGVVQLDNDGNLYLTGTSIYTTTNGWAYDLLTLKYDSNGNQAWAARYGGQTHEL